MIKVDQDYAYLKNMRKNVDWGVEKKRHEFLNELKVLISEWKGRLPNLREIFRSEEIDWLLKEDMEGLLKIGQPLKISSLTHFVIKTGYRDEPEVDQNGKLLLNRTTALHYVALFKNEIIVDEFFKIYNRFNVNYIDRLGNTHFHVACEFGLYKIVEQFLKLGQDPDCLAQKTVDSPLHLAVMHKHKKVVELLLRAGAKANLLNKEGLSPLHVICKNYCDDDSVKMLLLFFEFNNFKLGRPLPVQVNTLDQLGRTPLHYALAEGSKQIVRVLLNNGANIYQADKDGSTPLHVISKNLFISIKEIKNDNDLADMLFEFSEDMYPPLQVDAVDKFGKTPLHYALSEGCKKRIVRLLLKNGADPNMADAEGSTPLHIICNIRHVDDMHDLMSTFFKINDEMNQTVSVDARDKFGNTPLCLIVENGIIRLTELLLRRGADPNLANAEGSTPLHITCKDEEDDVDLAKILFEITDEQHQKLQVDARDILGQTPLQLAVVNLNPSLVDVLLDRGADLSSFIFPTESFYYRHNHFDLRITEIENLVFSTMSIVESLESKGYELDQTTALMIMKLFDKGGLFEKSVDLDKCFRSDEKIAKIAKDHKVISNLSLYEFIQMPPEFAEKLLTIKNYDKFKICDELLHWKPYEAYTSYLCETVTIGFFRRWALKLFSKKSPWLPERFCEMFIGQLKIKDLWEICVAATDQS